MQLAIFRDQWISGFRLNPFWAVGVRMEYTPYHTVQPKRNILFVKFMYLDDCMILIL